METKRFSWVQTFSRPMIEQAGFELESYLDGRAERELHRAIEEAGMEATHAMTSRAKWDVWWPPEGELAERELTDKFLSLIAGSAYASRGDDLVKLVTRIGRQPDVRGLLTLDG